MEIGFLEFLSHLIKLISLGLFIVTLYRQIKGIYI